MMLGGAPKCEGCSKTAYHAEQVMGPGRKIYHKLCLKCLNCGKRLDPGGLVEHDSQPYCSRCHVVLFGTRDLRHANHLPSVPNTPPKPPPTETSTPSYHRPAGSLSSARPLPPPTTDFYVPPTAQSLPPESATPTDPSTPITRPNFRDQRPISIPYAGGARALDDRGLLKKGSSPRTKVGISVAGDDLCGGCEKRVYAAEQVISVGHKWHRWCLKCNKCNTTLAPAKVSDRDGTPHCKNCYAKVRVTDA
ncbi:cysteine and glycine-rich protein [Cryptococcus wingfieldii CBS 7118]|uniref:Cysteine and glycine-rich protein n=1 Tax=Cryptococcus wingfieldii CBS 7118 TaxID=1295528 RepID=A0A1E3IIQ6_9TREE|nr:cysteine and glycine-rich protein [Cryptococcus wingfieldii CBS 7118]ODN88480.1 cysteine and glycine-rich protein [Cryptococcus wingfieldii CBS 7118]